MGNTSSARQPMTHAEARAYALKREAEGIPHRQIADELTNLGYRTRGCEQRITTGSVPYLLKPRSTSKWGLTTTR